MQGNWQDAFSRSRMLPTMLKRTSYTRYARLRNPAAWIVPGRLQAQRLSPVAKHSGGAAAVGSAIVSQAVDGTRSVTGLVPSPSGAACPGSCVTPPMNQPSCALSISLQEPDLQAPGSRLDRGALTMVWSHERMLPCWSPSPIPTLYYGSSVQHNHQWCTIGIFRKSSFPTSQRGKSHRPTCRGWRQWREKFEDVDRPNRCYALKEGQAGVRNPVDALGDYRGGFMPIRIKHRDKNSSSRQQPEMSLVTTETAPLSKMSDTARTTVFWV